MTWPAALPGAALRATRTAAGRRALELGLLVGLLFALGLVCGQQARAAEGGPAARLTETAPASVRAPASLPSSGVQPVVERVMRPVVEPVAGSVVERVVKPVAEPIAQPVVEGGVRPVVGPVVDSLVRPVVKPVVKPVVEPAVESVVGVVTGSVVRPVVQPVGDVVGAVVGGAVGAGPEAPVVPVVPGMPVVPGLPAPLPLPSEPQSGPVAPAREVQLRQPTGSAGPTTSKGHTSTPNARTGHGVTAPYGPRCAGATAGLGGATVRVQTHPAPRAGLVAPLTRLPAGHGPARGADGVLGDHAAADSGSSRHGDAPAVTLPERAPLRLLSGAAARTAEAGIRDRSQAVPVFPG
ncbi:hypothetical protein [Streptomyces sp. CB01373]|uniref:hypothetical protein n=1 Tax=Streptomyces sp. CB01373 TaxID=2020325 RepID=UPI00131C14D5|nr:hypothetical protein [Streptomyces sp. CB01373]